MTTTTTDLHPARDLATERWLDSHHATWTFEADLPIEKIDTAKSRANQARVDKPIIDDVLERYVHDWARGDIFPAVIAHRPSTAARKYVLLGGNHRHAAALANDATTIHAYVVECIPSLAMALAYSDNAHHGHPPTIPERVRQAVHLIGLGWTAQNAAAAVGVSDASVSIARKATEGSKRAKDLKIPGFDLIEAQSSKSELARISSDPVFDAAVRYVIDSGMASPNVRQLVAAIKKARNEADAIKLIDTEREKRRSDMQARAGGKAPRALRTQFGALNSAMANVLDVTPTDLVAPTPDSAERARATIRRTIVHLEQLAKALR